MSDPNYPQVPPASPWPQSQPAQPGEPAPPWTAPTPEPVPVQRRRPPAGRVVAVAVGVLAVGGGAVFAATALGGDSGASSPEEAGRRLLDAVAAEDILGVVDLLPSGERELFRDVTTGARDEYQRLGFLSEEFRLDGFPGIDIEITDPELDVDVVVDADGGDDGLALVTIVGGEAVAAVDGDELEGNLGEVVRDVAEERDAELDAPDEREEIDLEEAGISFAVVEEGGRWHPSVFFTIAELVRRRDGGLDEPDLDGGVDPDGESSPEEAVQAIVDAAVNLDAERAMALLDPGEARALHVYSQYFLPVEAPDTGDFEISAEVTEAEVDDLGGGARRVVPTGLEVRFEADGGTGDIVLDGGCVSIDIEPPPGEGDAIDEEFCAGDGPEDLELPDELAEVEISEELRDAIEAFQPLRFGIVTVERDGEHFVAPIRTAFDVVFGVTRGLEPEDLQEGGSVYDLLAGRLDDDVSAVFESIGETVFGFDELEDLGEDFEDFEDGGDFDRDDCVGVGCGFDDGASATTVPPELPTGPTREPTGASGVNGELLPGDAVAADVPPDGEVTFTAMATVPGPYRIGAQGVDGFDPTIRVLDAATGEELAANDDANGFDAEVVLDLAEAQLVVIEVAGFAGRNGTAVVYFE